MCDHCSTYIIYEDNGIAKNKVGLYPSFVVSHVVGVEGR